MFGLKVKAPEFIGISSWLNGKPKSIEKLRGKVILIDFWTYSCINCIRSIPYVKKWHKKYEKHGLVVIGVHSPEFEFEKIEKNVKKAVKELGIDYPVALDSQMKTWHAFDNMFWPAKFIIDQKGYIIDANFGEGRNAETEDLLQELLGVAKKTEKEEPRHFMFDQSTELYAGFLRSEGLGSGLACDDDGCNYYIDSGDHLPNVLYPNGYWEQEKECLELKKAPGEISYIFTAGEANVILEPLEKNVKVDVFIDDRKKSTMKIGEPGMYKVYKSKSFGEHKIGLVFTGKVKVFAFTFG